MSDPTTTTGTTAGTSTGSARDDARNFADDAREKAGKFADDVRSTARDAADNVRSEAEARAHDAKDSAADEVSGISSALNSAASEMRDGSLQQRSMSHIADRVAYASETLRDRDFGEMTQDLGTFARRNPALFLGGAALLGFAVARFAKSSEQPATGGAGDAYGRTPYDDSFAQETYRSPKPAAAGGTLAEDAPLAGPSTSQGPAGARSGGPV